jgi:hypothetical protein
VEHLKGASLSQAPAFPTNIGLGWKSLPGTNTVAYYKNPQITAVISFIVQAHGCFNVAMPSVILPNVVAPEAAGLLRSAKGSFTPLIDDISVLV